MINTVILADDHILIRDAIASLINTFPEFNVIALARDGIEVTSIIKEGCIPGIVILDLNMPKMDGYETAKWLRDNHPEIKILILTIFDTEIALIRLLQLGVKGFVKKDIHPDELKSALQSVSREEFYYSHQSIGKLGTLFKKNKDNHLPIEKAILSDTELSFIKMACTELTYKEIAKAMKLTPRMIDSFRDSLFAKLNVKSRVALAIYAVKNGVIIL